MRSDNQQQSLAGRDRFSDFVMEGELSRRHIDAIPPDVKTSFGQFPVEALHKRLVVAATIAEEDSRQLFLGGIRSVL